VGQRTVVRCPSCGWDQKPERLGLTSDGSFDEVNAQPNELCVRVDTYSGRGRICVERHAAPPHIALGIRAMLKFRLAQVEAELAAAGIELPDD
jgi:hypothetical protein